jgi:hypothetical protein
VVTEWGVLIFSWFTYCTIMQTAFWVFWIQQLLKKEHHVVMLPRRSFRVSCPAAPDFAYTTFFASVWK